MKTLPSDGFAYFGRVKIDHQKLHPSMSPNEPKYFEKIKFKENVLRF
jgi:hypothetical protein